MLLPELPRRRLLTTSGALALAGCDAADDQFELLPPFSESAAGQLGLNAATAVYVGSYSPAGGPMASGWNDFNALILVAADMPPFDCTVIVTATLNLSQASGASELAVAASYADDGSSYARGSEITLPISGTAQPVTVQWQFPHSASESSGAVAGFSIYNASGGSVTLVGSGNIQVQAEFIKR
jgi:hypothetical protein